jgi:hypothetical protein
MKRMIAAAIVAVALLSGCIPQYTGNPTGKRVGLLGDSTMDLEREELPPLLNDRYRTSFEAFPGYTVAGLQDEATLYAISKPDVMVISAGTMDVYTNIESWDGFQELLRVGATIDKFPGCVVWVNVMNGEGYPAPGIAQWAIDRANAFNASLRFWTTRYPNLRIVDWSGEVLAQGVDALLLPANPHANEKGQAVMATMIDAAIATC